MSNKPLPSAAVELVEVIQQEQLILGSTLETCINEGLDQRNFELAQRLLPRIKARAEVIKGTGQELQRKFAAGKRGRGRLPKWVEVILEITALADRVMQCVDLAWPEVRSNRWVTVDHLLRNKCRGFVQRMGGEISSIELPRATAERVEIPQVMREVFDRGKG